MRTMRMPKGWVFVGTNAMDFGSTETREQRLRKEFLFRKRIHNTPVLKYDELIEETVNADREAQERKASYEFAKKNGLLWTAAQKAESKRLKNLSC